MTSNRGHIFDWEKAPHSTYKGIILPNADVHSLHGGFGDLVFQDLLRKLYGLWYSNYQCAERFKTHSIADVSLIELSILLENSVAYTFANNLGRISQKRGQFNIFNSLDMDSFVQFEKGALYTTLDIHPKLELLQILYGQYPELLDPLLNAIAARREYMFFEKPLFLTHQMIQLVDLILDLIKRPILDTFLLDLCVITLFGFAIACKLETSNKNVRYERKLDIQERLTGLAQILIAEKQFRNISYYAREVGMSTASLKNHFRNFYGFGLEEFWRNEKMKSAFQEVVYTDKTIDEIAMDYGYCDSTAFTKAFKKIYKNPPSFFRQVKRFE